MFSCTPKIRWIVWLYHIMKTNLTLLFLYRVHKFLLAPAEFSLDGGELTPTLKVRFLNNQGSKGKRQWPINWCTFPMMIYKIIPSVDCNLWFKHLDTQLKKKKPIKMKYKSPKLFCQRIRKPYYKTLGISVINISMSPPALRKVHLESTIRKRRE